MDVNEYYRRYGPMVLRRCRRLLQDEEQAPGERSFPPDAFIYTQARLLRFFALSGPSPYNVG